MKRFNSKLPPSSVEASWKEDGIIIGVDEAGRGPVLGPMVYGAAFWNLNSNAERAEHKFDDSKKLTEESRETLYEFICRPKVPIGFFTCELSAELLSEQMQQCPTPVSLNKIAWDCTVELIQKIVLLGYPVRGLCVCFLMISSLTLREPEIYVDTVGKEDIYEKYLQDMFPDPKVTVRSKADSLFKVVSCASICAKVERDLLLKNWKHEQVGHNNDWGSGYPGDERTKEWLQANSNKVFGFPSVVRFSWQTTKTMLDTVGAARVDFPDDAASSNNKRITDMFQSEKRQCCKNLKFIGSQSALQEFGRGGGL